MSNWFAVAAEAVPCISSPGGRSSGWTRGSLDTIRSGRPTSPTAAEWVGAWWADALAALGHGGADELEIHTGRSVPGELGELVCFAGRGPGEVFHAGRKLVGVTQWRARQGALFSSCAYRCWDPAPLVELFAARVGDRAELTGRLQRPRSAWPSSGRRSGRSSPCGTGWCPASSTSLRSRAGSSVSFVVLPPAGALGVVLLLGCGVP